MVLARTALSACRGKTVAGPTAYKAKKEMPSKTGLNQAQVPPVLALGKLPTAPENPARVTGS